MTVDFKPGGASVPVAKITSCGDVSCEFLVDPIPRPEPEPFKVVMKPAENRVVLFDNQKPNAMEILRATQSILRARGIEVQEVIGRKERASMPLQSHELDLLLQEPSLLIMGVND